MEGTITSARAVLVDAEDAGGRPTATTVMVAREEIEEALASDDSPELLLELQLEDAEPRELNVAWQREDLETVLAATRLGRLAFSFEPSEIYRALEHPDFEAHGIREAVLLTVAAASTSTAMAVTTAQAGLVEGTTVGGTATPAVVSPGHDEATLVDRGLQPAPVSVPADSGSSVELPSVDPGTAALVGGLAGAGLLIVGGTFAARRRVGTP